MPKLFCLIFAMLSMLASTTQAATEVELINERTVDNETHTYIINGLYQNNHSRFTLHDPDDATKGAGIYVFSDDGGNTAFYVDTNDNSCHRWTNEQFTLALSEFLLEYSGKFNLKVTDLIVDKLIEETSEPVHELPTTHARYAISFNASYRYTLFKGQYTIERQTDYWTTPEIASITVSTPLFQNIGQHTGEQKADQQMSEVFGPDFGIRLRSEIKQTSTDKKGKKTSTKFVQYINTMTDVDDLPGSAFDIPECKNVGAKKMKKKFKDLFKNLLS